jgi:hypothetical protein
MGSCVHGTETSCITKRGEFLELLSNNSVEIHVTLLLNDLIIILCLIVSAVSAVRAVLGNNRSLAMFVVLVVISTPDVQAACPFETWHKPTKLHGVTARKTTI